MPELPEIETIKRGLEPLITGQSFTDIERRDVQPSQHPRGQIYIDSGAQEQILNSPITELNRRGKGLIISLESGWSLLIHLKMTGQIILVPPESESPSDRFGGGHPTKSMMDQLPDKSTRTIFTLSDKSKLYFNDQRKFGWIKVMPTSELENNSFLSRLGPEPWADEFSSDYLKDSLKNRTIAIKLALLDQHVIAGIGNIYADEALNLAQINPRRPANSLRLGQYQDVVEAVQSVMGESIDKGGTSFSDYVNHLGVFGDYLQDARVYGREGEPCKYCGGEIRKIKLGGRGTHFCSNCQR